MKLLAFMRPTSLLFVGLNLVRFLSIITMLLVVIGECISIADNIRGFQNRDTDDDYPGSTLPPLGSPTASPSASSSSRTRTRSSATQAQTSAIVTASVLEQPDRQLLRSISRAAQAQATILAEGNFFSRQKRSFDGDVNGSLTFGKRFIDTIELAATPERDAMISIADDACQYVDDTDVPDQTAGILFVCLARFLTIFILIFLAISELAPPVISRFYAKYFRPLSSESGVGWLGTLMVFIASNVLSHSVGNFEEVAGWMLFVFGLINVIVGLLLQGAVRDIRGLSGDSDSSTGKLSSTLSALKARANRTNASDSDAPSAVYRSNAAREAPVMQQQTNRGDRKIINISAPFRPNSPPAYLSQSAPQMVERPHQSPFSNV